MSVKQHINRVSRKSDPNPIPDFTDKEKVGWAVHELGHKYVTDQWIFINKVTAETQTGIPDYTDAEIFRDYYCHKVDVYITTKLPVHMVIEIDGEIHEASDHQGRKTADRNKHYDFANKLDYSIFTRKELRKMSLNQVMYKLKTDFGI